MENKIILKARNREELDKMIKRTLTLEEDERFEVTVLKEPKKILFFNVDGEYAVEIIKNEKVKKAGSEVINASRPENRNYREKRKFEPKEKKNHKENSGKSEKSTKKHVYTQTYVRDKNIYTDEVNSKKEERTTFEKSLQNDPNVSKIRGFIKEFIVNSKLDLKIVNISREGERYIVNVDGKDIRYLIGEKGSSLNAVEYLLSSVKPLKNMKVMIDSNNYKKKREEALRDLARKKGKKVFDSGKSIKLNPMSARERKIIHEEISFMKGLKTESLGEEPKRYLVIKKIT